MNIYTFIFLLFGLQIFYWIIGKRSSKSVNTNNDYFLAGKNVTFFPLMMTFLATQVGGGLVLGAADEAYRYGWTVFLYPLGAALGLMLLGMGVGRKLAEFDVSTVAQIFEVAYGSKRLKQAASLLSVISLFMVLVAQIIASSKFLTSIGMTSMPLFILFWAIVILYTVQGGLKAVISTDLVQAAFFGGVFLFCFAFMQYEGYPFFPAVGALGELSFPYDKLYGWLLMPLLFMVIEQDMGQRCFAGNSPRVVSKASFWSGIGTAVIGFVPIFIGIVAKSSEIVIPKGSSVLMVAIEQLTNPTLSAFVGCAVLAAIVSTATSLINAISSNLSNDFTLLSKKNVKGVQALTAAISIAAIFFAFFFDNIVDLLIQSFDLSVSCMFIPVAFALYKREGNKLSAGLSMALGACGFFLFRIYPIGFPKEVATILLSLMGYLTAEVYLRTQKQEQAYS
jgi:SSS family solute:Na+ symporter